MQTVEEEYVKLNKAFRKKETNISYYQRRKTTQLNIQPRFQRNTRNIMKTREPDTADKTQLDCKFKKTIPTNQQIVGKIKRKELQKSK